MLTNATHPLMLVALVGLLACVPLAMLACTSFLKVSIVLSMLRNAIGAQGLPSGPLITVLSLLLTMRIMSPIATVAYESARAAAASNVQTSAASKRIAASTISQTLDESIAVAAAAFQPFREFLIAQSGARERDFFARLGRDSARVTTTSSDALSAGETPVSRKQSQQGQVNESVPQSTSLQATADLLSAFVLSELRKACTMGVVVYLPFLAVDLLVTHVLMALGMMMVSPLTISVPLKLLLFVATDGWLMLTQSLILSYG